MHRHTVPQHEHGRLLGSQLAFILYGKRCRSGEQNQEIAWVHYRSLYERALHRVLEEQSTFTQATHPCQATLLELVGEGGKGLGKTTFLEGSPEG